MKSITDAPDVGLFDTTSLQNHLRGCKWKVIHLSIECKMGNSLTPVLSTKAGNIGAYTSWFKDYWPKLRKNWFCFWQFKSKGFFCLTYLMASI